jgi:hypothetical protein
MGMLYASAAFRLGVIVACVGALKALSSSPFERDIPGQQLAERFKKKKHASCLIMTYHILLHI